MTLEDLIRHLEQARSMVGGTRPVQVRRDSFDKEHTDKSRYVDSLDEITNIEVSEAIGREPEVTIICERTR